LAGRSRVRGTEGKRIVVRARARVAGRAGARRKRAHLGAHPRRGERALDPFDRRAHRRTAGAQGLASRTAILRDEGGEGGMTRLCVAALCAAAMVAAGCGGDNEKSTGGSTGAPTGKAKTGGNLTVLYNGDVDYVDPGVTYYQYGFNVAYMTQRPLYSYKPGNATAAVPDLAAGPAKISNGGKTVTVKIRNGIRFSPPVNREVTSADVKYALERGYNPNVAGEYLAYFGDVKGAAAATKNAKAGTSPNIAGIETPDKYTIRFQLDRPRAAIVVGALSLPASAPVPKAYAERYDKQKPSQYGTHQVSTGPYMIENKGKAKASGYKPGTLIKLVRNPNWKRSTDYKPAYLDSITIEEGVDPDVGSRRILNGQGLANGDFQLPPQIIKSVSQGPKKNELVVTPPTGRFRYIAFDVRKKPFDNINVRKAIAAAFDRTALRQAFGGPATGDIPTHFIPPGQPGFQDAGGTEGPGYNFMENPAGDMDVATAYMKKAGFPSGKYTGGKTFLAIGDSATQQRRVVEVAQNQFAKLGFKVDLRFVKRQTMYTKYCQVPAEQPPICPSVGWLKDFADPETLLDLTFNGKNILKSGNSNFANLDDPKINAAMRKAEVITDRDERNKAWGEIDKMITAQAPGVLWLWDKQPNLESTNVNGVINRNLATWDFAYTSLK
jgi:peptide/nickel transport system substrate-binding protein